MSETPLMPPEGGPATAGQLLRAARERQGLHISVLAASLKVSRRKIELMESDGYAELPDATFVRALALSMCRALKLDAGLVLAGLPPPHSHMLDPSRGLNRPFRHSEPGRWREISERRALSLPLLAALVLVVAGLALQFLPIDFSGLTAQWMREVSTSQAEASAPTEPQGAAGVVEGVRAAASSSGPAGADVIDTTPAPVASSSLLGVAASVPAPVSPSAASAPVGLLGLRASEASWVEVRDAQGQVIMARHLVAGEAVSLDGRLPLRLTVGNAAATQITFRGQAVSLSESTRENVARLELK